MSNGAAPEGPRYLGRRELLRLAAAAAVAARLSGPSLARAAGTRLLTFGTANGAALLWAVKASTTKVGPGPNFFSDSEGDVWVDQAGLHLSITKQRNQWRCTEVIGQRSLGYGTYQFLVDSPLNNLDPNTVLGLFTWSDDTAYNHREIDIEFSRWGNANAAMNAQYTVQPAGTAGNLMRFSQGPVVPTIHRFTWLPDRVMFASWDGTDTSGPPTHQWEYRRPDVPIPGNENPRLNLWLFRGRSSRNQALTLTIKDFVFTAV